MLSQMFRTSCSKSNDGSSTFIDHINSNHHGILVVEFESVQIKSQLSINLLQDVAVKANGRSASFSINRSGYSIFQHKLRRNSHFVQVLLNQLLHFFVPNKDHYHLDLLRIYHFLYLFVVILISAPVWKFNPKRIRNLGTKSIRSLSHSITQDIGFIIVIFAVEQSPFFFSKCHWFSVRNGPFLIFNPLSCFALVNDFRRMQYNAFKVSKSILNREFPSIKDFIILYLF